MFKKGIFLGSLLCFPFVAFAANVDFYLSGGASFSKLSTNESIEINPSVTNAFDTDSKNRTSFLGGLGLGHTFENISQKPIAIGVALMVYYQNFGKIEGIEHPLANLGQFDTLDYQFKAESTAGMIESRFIYTQYPIKPFALLGLGASWNHLYDYSSTPSDPSGSAVQLNDSVNNHTTTAFTYEAGLGIQYLFVSNKKSQWRVSLDYRYINFGEGELGDFPGQVVNDPLKINNLDTQAVVFTLEASV